MSNPNTNQKTRRSSRLQVNIPVLVTRVEGGLFSEVGETLALNAHGCALRVPASVEAGVPLHVQLKSGRHTTGQVLNCERLDSGHQGWRLGLSLDRPGNFWGLDPCPEDWAPEPEKATRKELPISAKTIASVNQDPEQHRTAPFATVGTSADHLPPDHRVTSEIEQALRALQAEVARLQDKVSGDVPKSGRFEISLSHIPDEVREKIRQQLHEELGAEVLRQTREQSDQMLQAVQQTFEQRIQEVQGALRQHASGELDKLQQRAQALSDDVARQLKDRLQAETESLGQKSSAAGAGLDRRAEELLSDLQRRLAGEYDTHRREMQAAHAAIGAESSVLQGRIADLDGRISKLDESASRLESELDQRLAATANQIIADARIQLEAAVQAILHELGQRNAKELEGQLEQACKRLTSIQRDAEASASELLRSESAESLQSFEQTIEEMAQHSVSRWRLALAEDLESMSKLLGGQLRTDKMADGENLHSRS
jgi:hypothetical protein